MLILGMICAFYHAFTGGGAIITMIECQREKTLNLGLLTTTCIFQRIALLIGWAKDQAGRIRYILDGKKR
jgi:hypothetical protein